MLNFWTIKTVDGPKFDEVLAKMHLSRRVVTDPYHPMGFGWAVRDEKFVVVNDYLFYDRGVEVVNTTDVLFRPGLPDGDLIPALAKVVRLDAALEYRYIGVKYSLSTIAYVFYRLPVEVVS